MAEHMSPIVFSASADERTAAAPRATAHSGEEIRMNLPPGSPGALRPTLGLLVALLSIMGGVCFPLSALAAAGPRLSLEPGSGPCGIRVIARGTGWPAGFPVALQRGGDNGPQIGQALVAADGTFAVGVVPCAAAAPEPVGYRLSVVAGLDKAALLGSSNPTRLPSMFATTTFTVTDASMILPRTGGADVPIPLWLVLLGALGCVAGGLGMRQYGQWLRQKVGNGSREVITS